MILRTINVETSRGYNLCDECFNSIPASDFIAIVYISANKVPLDKTWNYLFPSKSFFWPTIMSDSHISSNRFFCIVLSDQYLHDNDITVYHISCCVILLSVSFACSIPIYHHSLRSSGNTNEWIPLDTNVFSCVTYYNSINNWDTFLGINHIFAVAINLCDRSTMSYRYRLYG